MSTTTTHFGLVKQEGHEYPSLTAINSNLDTIDDELYNLGQAVTDISSEIGAVPSGKTVQGQIQTLSDSVSWSAVVDRAAANTEKTFNASGKSELLVMIALSSSLYDWFTIFVPIAFIDTNNRAFDTGNKDWSHAFVASKSGNTVTCKVTSTASGALMWVLAR